MAFSYTTHVRKKLKWLLWNAIEHNQTLKALANGFNICFNILSILLNGNVESVCHPLSTLLKRVERMLNRCWKNYKQFYNESSSPVQSADKTNSRAITWYTKVIWKSWAVQVSDFFRSAENVNNIQRVWKERLYKEFFRKDFCLASFFLLKIHSSEIPEMVSTANARLAIIRWEDTSKQPQERH